MLHVATESFRDEQQAADFLLRESTKLLADSGVGFAVVGGWAPFLFHRERYGHPGTYDVDVLLDSASLENGTFEQATEAMLSAGYMRAAKNNFQAHRIVRVRDEEMIFHVDFLNESAPGNTIDLVSGKGRLRSIYTPAMEAVFTYANFRKVSDPGMSHIRFPSPETFIASKAAATSVAKRTRDAFDVFVTVADQPPEVFAERWRSLVKRDGLFQDANDALWNAIHKGDARAKIRSVLDQLGKRTPVTDAEITKQFEFLDEAGSSARR